MKRTVLIGFALLFLVLAYVAFRRQAESRLTPVAGSTVERVQTQFLKDVVALDSAVGVLTVSVERGGTASGQQAAFRRARLAWKKVEWLTEYYFPATAKAINGAAIPEFEESDAKTIEPEGFQVLEPLLFPAPEADAQPARIEQAKLLASNVKRLRVVAQNNPTTDAHLFDALRMEVFRIISLGITGFDSPVANYSLPETASALASIEACLRVYQDELRQKNKPVADSLQAVFARAYPALQPSGPDAFNRFDRLAFITGVANPLSSLLLDAQRALGIQPFAESRGLRSDTRTLFDPDAFDVNHYAPGGGHPGADHRTTPDRIALGKQLFFDPVLSGGGRRSCASCHQPERAFTDALPRNVSLDGRKPVLRNTPTLWNVGLQRALFADSRVVFLEDQATDVVTNREEMHGSFDQAVVKLSQQPAYVRQFAKTYTEGMTSFTIRNALASYERSLVSLNSRFDRYIRGEKTALTGEERLGFNLFAGKAKCATCHFLPLTNGLVPPQFEKSESENLGVPQRLVEQRAKLDEDAGKINHTGAAIHQHLFKTPTVRNSALTAPYMHNGSFRTLEEVIDFYDRGGGKGLGIEQENQTLPEDPLHLSLSEKAALVAFLKALTDAPSAL